MNRIRSLDGKAGNKGMELQVLFYEGILEAVQIRALSINKELKKY